MNILSFTSGFLLGGLTLKTYQSVSTRSKSVQLFSGELQTGSEKDNEKYLFCETCNRSALLTDHPSYNPNIPARCYNCYEKALRCNVDFSKIEFLFI
jgi:hypothetical protein